ncbi:MAG TPA: ABC transporter ATP-binding protein [Solibacterales bacterium]|nr:ABC transporter ATP-binding protein [Bryobacterales bacterium]
MTVLDLDFTAGYRPNAPVLRGLRLRIEDGEIVGLAGQSGSGKSTLALSVLGLLPDGAWREGRIRLEGEDLLGAGERRLRQLRGRRIAYVPQSPLAALNPYLTIGSHFEEAWRAHAGGAWKAEALHALERAALPGTEEFLKLRPRALSVGMAQRVLVALAILHEPAVILADEPTSALDPINASEVLSLFARLSREIGLAVLLISHDLPGLASCCHRLAVLNEGAVVEEGPPVDLLESPSDPYTKRLVAALPRLAVPEGVARW